MKAGNDLCLAALKHLHRGEARAFASLLLSRRLAAPALADFLVRERLAVFAYAAISELNLLALLPRQAAASLQDQWQQQQQRDTRLLAELARIRAAFGDGGIDFLLLKGLYISERFYGGRGRRFTWDLDLLVAPAAVGDALTILARLGFSRPRFTLGVEHIARHVTHALECQQTDGLSADLHWGLRQLPGLRIDHAAVWSTSRTHAFGELSCRVPADEYSLLLMLLGIAADLDRSLCRLRSLWDVYMMLHGLRDFDWPGFLARRVADATIGLVANALALVLYRLDGEAEFPALAQALHAYGSHLTAVDARQVQSMLARPQHSLANHFAFLQWQPLAPWRYALWWTATLPLRMFYARRL